LLPCFPFCQHGQTLVKEHQGEKRLGLWLKEALDRANKEDEDAHAHETKKCEMIQNYVECWRFIYSVYHGKCLSWALLAFYGGASDADPPTCFVSNSPLCFDLQSIRYALPREL